jgi:hypothetical protein
VLSTKTQALFQVMFQVTFQVLRGLLTPLPLGLSYEHGIGGRTVVGADKVEILVQIKFAIPSLAFPVVPELAQPNRIRKGGS